jgi:hypothetical protein
MLQAAFSISRARVETFIAAMNERTGSPVNVRVLDLAGSAAHCLVSGPAQDVSHVIGEVAAQGEAALMSVGNGQHLGTAGAAAVAYFARADRSAHLLADCAKAITDLRSAVDCAAVTWAHAGDMARILNSAEQLAEVVLSASLVHAKQLKRY